MNQKDHYLGQKNKKVIELMKDELGRKIMAELAAFRPRTYSYLKYDNDENKKVKGTKKCVIKHKFEDYENCLVVTQLENEINYLEKNEGERFASH